MENLSPLNEPESFVSGLSKERKRLFFFIGLCVFVILFNFLFFSAPIDFPISSITKIEPGSNLRGVSLKLKQHHLIRSRVIFEAFVILFGREKRIISTDYYFENKLPVYEIAWRISKGVHNLAPVSVTIPEGFDRNQIANAFSMKLTDFNKDVFILQTKNLEGYLFPDTYFFQTTDDEHDVLNSMTNNFIKKVSPLVAKISSIGKTEKEIIIMASVVEREAKGDVDRGIISGILWHRISIGMPLQVDAAPETYKTRGLPKTPISNPGLEAITAAIYPQKSPYLYYLHDKEGNIHYAKTFAEHVKNKLRYLK